MKLPRLGAAQGAEQNPFTGADRVRRQQFRTAEIHPQRQILQIPLQVPGRVGHHQPVSGPGHGHVQHPHFLGEALRAGFGRDGPSGNGGIAHPFFRVRHGKSQSQLLIAEHLGTQAFPVEFPAQSAQKHHREFQSLGLVDTHDADAPGRSVFPRRHQPLLLHHVQIFQKLSQLPAGGGLIIRRHL